MKRIFLIYIGVMCCVSLCMAQSYDEGTGLRLFKEESYQSCAFKQFKDAKEVIYNGVWHHIVLTFSLKNKKAEIYVDDNWKGNEYVSESNSLKKMCLVFCAGSQDLKIGNLRLFKNKVLDRMEISVLYSNELSD